jgi:predicted O-methyltransferase YrrM
MKSYEFSNTWFKETAQQNFEWLLPRLQPKKVLEIGSFEGASTCFLIDFLTKDLSLEIHCIDTWLGGREHYTEVMLDVEMRFMNNTAISVKNATNKVDLVIHKGTSAFQLAKLLTAGVGNFDFIYVDGSHEAPDVIADAVLAFKLLKPGGVMGFDDYSWGMHDLLKSPKIAIDSFINIHSSKCKIVNLNLTQVYIQKVAD